jgi:hypothetical protein
MAAKTRNPPGDIARIVAALGDLVPVLADAHPAKKAETYSQLGLTLKYRPAERTVQVAARPIGPMYVRKCPRSESLLMYMPAVIGELVLKCQQ